MILYILTFIIITIIFLFIKMDENEITQKELNSNSTEMSQLIYFDLSYK
jgi:hypothetical protein